MASPKAQVANALNELTKLRAKAARLETAYEKEIEPELLKLEKAQVKFEGATEQAKTAFEAKQEPVLAQIKALETEISNTMLAKTNAKKEPLLASVAGGKLKAETAFTEKRVINGPKFFEAAKSKAGFWDCVSVLIGKAEKLVGKTELEKFCEKSRAWRVEIREV